MRHKIAHFLILRHKASGPCRRVFHERTCKRYAGLVRIADGMCCAGIRNTRHRVKSFWIDRVVLGQNSAAVIAHLFYVFPLIVGGRISIIRPEERADLHLFSGGRLFNHLVRRNQHNFPRSQFLIFAVTQIQVCGRFKRYAETVLLFSDDKRGAAQTVARGINTVLGQNQQRHRAVDTLLRIADALGNAVLLIDDCRSQLRRIDMPAAHLKKMGFSAGETCLGQLFFIVDPAHRCNRIGSKMRTHNQGLRLHIADAANSHIARHFVYIAFKLCPKRRVFDVVDGTRKA